MANNLPRLRVLDMHRFGDDISDRAMVDVLKAVAEASTAAKVIGLIPTTSASPGVSPSTFSVQNDYPGVQSLTIQGTKFPLPNLVSLIVSPSEPFIHSLETLVLKGCWRLKSFELQRILTSCVNLVRLEAQTIQSNASPHSLAIPLWQLPTWYNPDHFAFDSRMDPIFKIQDLCSVDGAAEKESNNLIDVSSSTSSSLISWQCLKLERLHLCYEEPSQDEGQASAQRPLVGLPQMLWQQISRLERLEDLCLYRINPSNEITPTDGITDTEKTMLAGTRTGAFKVIDFESLPKTPTTKEQFRAALEDWHVSLTRLRRIQLQGLYAFVDPIAWRAYQQKMFPRLEWARLH
ncbi:hypothetical protein BGZ83_002732 [Gryganskiella cystojenkinii]|nr:hypothetical protein BGZ83_002732 [Gryganskiella cystojenkinii]